MKTVEEAIKNLIDLEMTALRKSLDRVTEERDRFSRALGREEAAHLLTEQTYHQMQQERDRLKAENGVLESLRQKPCACACHTVAGHADEPTMGMMLAEAQKEIARLKTDLGDMTANCGTLKHVTRLSAQENARLRRALTDCMQVCDEWKEDSLEGVEQ